MSLFFQTDAGMWPGLVLGLLLAASAIWLYRRECRARRGRAFVEHLRGKGDVAMSTDEIMALTRGEANTRRENR